MKVYHCYSNTINCPIYLNWDVYQIDVDANVIGSSGATSGDTIDIYVDESAITGTTFPYNINVNTSENSGITRANIHRTLNDVEYVNTVEIQQKYNNPINMSSYLQNSPEFVPQLSSSLNLKVLSADEYNVLTEYDKNTLYFVKYE